MIKDNQKVFNRLLVIMDALITAISFVLAYYIKFYILNDGPGIGVLPVQEYYKLLPFIVPGYMFSILPVQRVFPEANRPPQT